MGTPSITSCSGLLLDLAGARQSQIPVISAVRVPEHFGHVPIG